MILLIGLLGACATKERPKGASPGKVGDVQAGEAKLGERQPVGGEEALASGEPTASKKKKGELPKVVLIITTQACHCTLERCAKGEKIVNKIVEQFPEELALIKLDQAREAAAADSLIRRFGVHYLPALFFFDGKGNFQGELEGFWDEGTIIDKLVGIGVE